MKKLVLAIALIAFGATASFAQNGPAAKTNEKATEHANHSSMAAKKSKKTAKTANMVYECPMKCTPASDKPGKCPKCGMDLKAKKA